MITKEDVVINVTCITIADSHVQDIHFLRRIVLHTEI